MNLQKKIDVLVMVDFERCQDYVTWKRASEIQNNIYMLKKNAVVFDRTFMIMLPEAIALPQDFTTIRFIP